MKMCKNMIEFNTDDFDIPSIENLIENLNRGIETFGAVSPEAHIDGPEEWHEAMNYMTETMGILQVYLDTRIHADFKIPLSMFMNMNGIEPNKR